MEGARLQKIERQIQKDLSEIFLSQTRQMNGIMVSVTRVRVSPDLGLAKGYLSIFPTGKAEEILNNINASKKSIRYELGTKVGKQLRRVPELAFFIDDSIDYLEHIDDLLKKDKEGKAD